MDYGYETLGDNVVPSNYDIKLELDLAKFQYQGYESIDVIIKSKTDSVFLNAKDMDIIDAEIEQNGKKHFASITSIPEKEQIELKLRDKLSGNAKIQIRFRGYNNDKMYGFYRSSYKNEGVTEYMLTTQFEAADARAAFPCFDEPAFKSTFNLSLVMPKGFDAISNTEIKSQTTKGDKKVVVFETTPKMSDYLLYIGVGKFEYTEGELDGLKIRVVSTPGKKSMCKLPLEFTRKFVAYYQKYFSVKYPLKKLDIIAVPDFAVGAMENWGAITFREVRLLADQNTAVANKQGIAEVIAHELAHQWFGDLVTMKWWNDLWLNESFATFMSYKAVDATFPEWRMGTQYLLNVMGTALNADALESTHPISVNVNNPKEIDSIFDEISYEKGGSVLHMLEDYSGHEIFRKGLSDYLKAYSYANATKYDLWNAIDKAASKAKEQKKIKYVAGYWIDNPGYPVVKCSSKGGAVSASQERFTMLGSNNKGIWPIPIHTISDKGKQLTILMEGKAAKFNVGDADWVKLNYTQSGLYRVLYDDANLERLGKAISNGSLNGTEAWGIENDLFVIARSGMIKLSKYTDFIERYCLDRIDEYPLNFSISGHLSWLQFTLYDTKLHQKIDSISLAYHEKILKKLGWERKSNESDITTILRSMAISGLGLTGHKPTAKKAAELFNDYINGGKAIEPNIRGAVYKISAWNGNADTHEKLIELYKKEPNPEEQRRLLIALAMFRDPALLSKTLDFSFSDSVRLQDSYIPSFAMADNPCGKLIVWKWSKKNWHVMLGKFISGTHLLKRYVENMRVISDKRSLSDFDRFFAEKENMRQDIEGPVRKTAERIKINIRFLEANLK